MTRPTLEVLHVADCPHLDLLLERLRRVTDLPVTLREIRSEEEAEARGMAGSPTLLVDGVAPLADPADGRGLSCLIEPPSQAQLRDLLASASITRVLREWRTRALPLDPVEQVAHRAILRSFAETGRAPASGDLAADVLRALHEADAIRLDSRGEVVVAYPFSAAPTRHRVTIGEREVYARCAIDALGVAPMLGRDTRIGSVDVSTGRPITVDVIAGETTWDPAGTVVFVGADRVGGPSADCCCDYLNFFADRGAAEAWRIAHPQVPGQVLTQVEALDLADNLFGELLKERTP